MKTAEQLLGAFVMIEKAYPVDSTDHREKKLEAIRTYGESVREECARVAETVGAKLHPLPYAMYTGNEIASAIRSLEIK
jgi:hypothetical protein